MLYKYTCSSVGLTVISGSTIRFTQLGALNDPFESFYPTYAMMNPDLIRGMLVWAIQDQATMAEVARRSLEKIYTERGANSPEAREAINKELQEELDKNPEFLKKFFDFLAGPAVDAIHKGFMDGVPKMLEPIVCALSLTEVPANELMWAHYANSHQGLVLGFDSSDGWFAEHFAIQYVPEPPKLRSLSFAQTEEQRKLFMRQVYGSKNIRWDYEREHRVLCAAPLLEPAGSLDTRGFPVLVRRFPPSSLREVVIGLHTASADIERVKQVLSEERYSHVKLRHVRMMTDPCMLTLA